MFDVFGDVRFKEDQMFERSVCEHRLHVFVEPASGNKDRSRAGVGKNVIDLFERLGRVDGNVDRAETQDREISDRPFGTILRKECDAIAGADAKTRQAERDVFHSLDKSRRGDVEPLAVAAVIESVVFVVT